MAVVAERDRVGIGWRPEIGLKILQHADEIDLVEVIADDYFDRPKALATLAAQIPIALHGVTMGPASTIPVEKRRVEKFARLVNTVEPLFWSEHLAFVRAGKIEIGHLAAPPRNEAVIEGTLRNLHTLRRAVGSCGFVENIATLIDPPGSDMSECDFVRQIVETSGTPLLLDLHNLHANAQNFGFSAVDFLRKIPRDKIGAIHISGGRYLPNGRILDDHVHDVPDAVFALLSEVASLTKQPLTVILERDGEYPSFEILLDQIRRARHAIETGRNVHAYESAV